LRSARISRICMVNPNFLAFIVSGSQHSYRRSNRRIWTDQIYIYLLYRIGNDFYIHSGEYNIPFYSTIKGYNKGMQLFYLTSLLDKDFQNSKKISKKHIFGCLFFLNHIINKVGISGSNQCYECSTTIDAWNSLNFICKY